MRIHKPFTDCQVHDWRADERHPLTKQQLKTVVLQAEPCSSCGCRSSINVRLPMFFSELKFKAPYSLNAVFLNPGNVRIYRPSEKHAAPTLQQMHAMAEDDNSPAGFLIMDKDARKDQIYLVLGFGADKETVAMQQLRVPAALAQEIRAYLATRPPSQKYLIVDQKHSVSLDCAKPYASEAGRASFMARLNRLLVKHFDCRCRQFRVACALHHSELARKEMMEEFSEG